MAQTAKKAGSAPSRGNGTAASGGARKTKAPDRAPRRREVGAVVCLLLGVFAFLGFRDGGGVFIGFFRDAVRGLIGSGFFALAPALLLCAVILCFHRGRPVRFRVVCALMLPAVAGALIHLFACDVTYKISFAALRVLWTDGRKLVSGGAVSGGVSELFLFLFGKAGAAIVFICAALFLLLSASNRTIAGLVDMYKNRARREYRPSPPAPAPPGPTPPQPIRRRRRVIDIELDDPIAPPSAPEVSAAGPGGDATAAPQQRNHDAEAGGDGNGDSETPPGVSFADKRSGKRGARREASPAADGDDEGKFTPPPDVLPSSGDSPGADGGEYRPEYAYPPIEMLASGAGEGRVDASDEIRVNTERLVAAFRSFGVNVRVTNTTRGPSVTRYEAELEAGVKLSRLTGLADDIALSLGTSSVRISAMPNKISTVGIEVPNKLISKVYLRDIIESPQFKNAASGLTFAIGKNISGEAITGDISRLPHMLVAGTTGSGKSVCLNSLILSLLYKATPDDVRFIMIDPKMVEFRVYNGIPHLLVPVVTDVQKASGALQWAVTEMMKRYRLFSESNARDIESYNKLARKSDDMERLPKVVIVIDELADLMMTAAKEVEESICRVAQMGRAAGVHLVIATQSPRADVITGLMKANIPSRIALKVSSALESRIILDAGGNAEKLVGNGDMLFSPVGVSKPMRVQGTWVTDGERENVVDFIKKQSETQYSEEVIIEIDRAAEEKSSGGKQDDESDYDELLPQAVDVIFETGQASVSMLQRRLKLGYSRAARIVDQMERMGIVGAFEGSKPRPLLITKQRWREMQYISGAAPADSFIPAPDASPSEIPADADDGELF
ncbi:MAG: DNA translocase FtsK [Oscillospiraceae bacterium]|jgi:S-DNA-T family DNA segregation ATPase FtsK/SpoIIIE|nr:DNA translocase FtsK [Oscillospiraceae bacterium]